MRIKDWNEIVKWLDDGGLYTWRCFGLGCDEYGCNCAPRNRFKMYEMDTDELAEFLDFIWEASRK